MPELLHILVTSFFVFWLSRQPKSSSMFLYLLFLQGKTKVLEPYLWVRQAKQKFKK